MIGSIRYSPSTRRKVLAAAGKTTNPKDLARVLRRFGVPRTTYLAWLERWQELGTVDDARLGRPPARVRSIVREEVERGLEKWLGTPHPDDESDPA